MDGLAYVVSLELHIANAILQTTTGNYGRGLEVHITTMDDLA